MTIDPTTIIEYSHDDFKLGISHIARLINYSDFKPDYIVGIVRGGAVPAVYLSHHMKIPVQMVHWNTRDAGLSNESNCWIPEDVTRHNKKVLIIDDIVDGGETIKELLDDWQSSIRDQLNMSNIRVAAMIYNTSCGVNVDFYHKSLDRSEDSRWVVFDWEC